jgi:hypothetical protein
MPVAGAASYDPTMSVQFRWQTPAWNTPLDRADRVEVFYLPARNIVPDEGWPTTFWRHVGERVVLHESDAQQLIGYFRDLEEGLSARCHMPPWGVAFYAGDELLFTVTLCFECTNAYVYNSHERNLRAFDVAGSNAVNLRAMLERILPLAR